ncbi:MAG: SCO family protein [Candidatus Thiodiazotropha sp.]
MPDSRTIRLGWTFLLAVPALIGGLLAILYFYFPNAVGKPQQPLHTEASAVGEPRRLKAFSLTDQLGQTYDNQRLLGHWTFMSFGYTYCPDICPTTLSIMSEVSNRIRAQAQHAPFQVVFVSIDPERDTPARLAEYVTYFDPAFLGVTGTQQELQKLTRPLGILYQRVDTQDSAMGYVMDHTASIILVDPQGRFFAYFLHPHDADSITRDFTTITQSD